MGQAGRASEGQRQEERRCKVIYKRGKKGTYYIKFMWRGKSVFRSARTTNPRVARQVEAATRNALAQGNAGILERKPAPTLKEFCDRRVEPWAKATFEHTCVNNWLWFRSGLRRLRACESLAKLSLDEITNEKVAGFAAHEQTRSQNRGKNDGEEKRGLAVSSINSSIRVLRRVLTLAVEWGVIESAPTLALLSGERHRDRVLTFEEEMRYLAAAPPLLADVATVLTDTGIRPEECYRMDWADMTLVNGRNGSVLVRHGKTAAARRMLPMTPRVRAVLEMRWESAGKPTEGWVWPAPTASGHIGHSSLKKLHAKAVKLAKVRPFVLYSLRHTFLTRLGESGCDAWTLARIAGHSSISMSKRYVHPSEDAVLAAMEKLTLTGCNSGSRLILSSSEAIGDRILSPEPMYNYEERARSSAG